MYVLAEILLEAHYILYRGNEMQNDNFYVSDGHVLKFCIFRVRGTSVVEWP